MILPKTAKPSKADETDAYEAATLRDDNTCQRCRRDCGRGFVSRDHRKNRSQGGLTVVSNLQCLGGTGNTGCHGWVTEHPRDALAEGWAVPSWADPAEWPARRYVRDRYGVVRLSWVLYKDDGTVIPITAEEALRRMEGRVA